MMDSGVKGYISTKATVEVYFPIDFNNKEYVSCRHCRFFKEMSNRCALNNEVCDFPEKYVGSHCPLEIVNEQ